MKSDLKTSYDELKQMYSVNFSLGYINNDIGSKFFLISVVCYLTKIAKEKNPNITYLQIIKKLTEKMDLPESFLVGFAIVCEDFAYGCDEFPLFGVPQKEIIMKARKILESYLPF